MVGPLSRGKAWLERQLKKGVSEVNSESVETGELHTRSRGTDKVLFEENGTYKIVGEGEQQYAEGDDVGSVINSAMSEDEALAVAPGSYNYSTTITVPGLSIIGSSLQSTRFKAGAAVAFYSEPSDKRFNRPIFEHFTINGDGTGTDGIELTKDCQKFKVENIEVINVTRDAFRLLGGYNGTFTEVRAQPAGRYGLFIGMSEDDEMHPSDVTVIAPQLQGKTAGCRIDGQNPDTGATVAGVQFYSGELGGGPNNTGNGLDLGKCAEIQLWGTNIENSDTALKVGDSSLQNFLPSQVTLDGVSVTDANIALDVQSGNNISNYDLRTNGVNNIDIRYSSYAFGNIYEYNFTGTSGASVERNNDNLAVLGGGNVSAQTFGTRPLTAGTTYTREETNLSEISGANFESTRRARVTKDVSTTAKAVYGEAQNAALVVVHGENENDGLTSNFIDLVLCVGFGSAVTVGSTGRADADTRNYSMDAYTLELSMSGGTYDIVVEAMELRAQG
jgi:hypothetical protein